MRKLECRPIPIESTRPLRHSVLRPKDTIEVLASHEPPGAFAVGAFEGGELISVGFIGCEGEPGSWRIRGMATAPQLRGRGAGTAVLDALVTHARSHGARRIWCNARTPALSLYERAGFRAISGEFEISQIGPHFVMELRPGSGPA